MNKLPAELLNKILQRDKTNIANFRKVCFSFAVLRVKIKNNYVHYCCGIFLLKQINCEHLFDSITHLTFDNSFNETVNTLSATLTHLTFGYYFNQKVDTLPATLKQLTFGYWFNQKVDALPATLAHLTFGNNYYL